MARARGRLDGQRHVAPAPLALGAAGRGAAGAARARRALAVLAPARNGRKSRDAAAAADDARSIPPLREPARCADRPRRGAPGPARYGRSGAAVFAPRDEDAPNLLLAEAGTGIGKTLGYLAPASLWARAGGRRGLGLDLHQGAAAPAGRAKAPSSSPTPPSASAGSSSARAARIISACSISRTRCRAASPAAPRSSPSWSRAGPPIRKDGDMVGGDLPGWLPTLFRRAGATALTDRRGECVYAGCPHYRRCFIERAARAEPRGRPRHRQPRLGDGQRRARPRDGTRRRGSCSTRAIICSTPPIRPSPPPSAARRRSSCAAGSSAPKAARAAAGAGSRRG